MNVCACGTHVGGFGILANFSKLVVTSVLIVPCGKMLELFFFSIMIYVFMVHRSAAVENNS